MIRTAELVPVVSLLLVSIAAAACREPAPEPDPTAVAPPTAPGVPPVDVGVPPAGRPPVEAPTLTVQVYFTRREEPEPVEREIPRGAGVLRATLNALLQGPTAAERAAGLVSWFSVETAGMLRDVHLDDGGRATVDFGDLPRMIPAASTAAGGRMLLNELNHTIFQFDTVRAVEYRIEGNCDAFWQWLQSECGVVTRP
jgi:spore germination protein GerM